MALSKEEVQKIFGEVRANRALLDACAAPHTFLPHEKYVGGLVRSFKCSKCGGIVETLHKHWYEMGLKHGKLP